MTMDIHTTAVLIVALILYFILMFLRLDYKANEKDNGRDFDAEMLANGFQWQEVAPAIHCCESEDCPCWYQEREMGWVKVNPVTEGSPAETQR